VAIQSFTTKQLEPCCFIFFLDGHAKPKALLAMT
jgi:hypothetical protein